jgi:uncharacterized membrane protein
MKASDFFSSEEQESIMEAIKAAEKDASGEIRVHIETRCDCDVLERSVAVFKKLKMHKTKLRNGVLFYLAIEDHKFAVIGDAGINKVVAPDFWDCIKETMIGYFIDGRFAEGLEKGILIAGQKLKEYFPYQSDDINELSDEISFGTN